MCQGVFNNECPIYLAELGFSPDDQFLAWRSWLVSVIGAISYLILNRLDTCGQPSGPSPPRSGIVLTL